MGVTMAILGLGKGKICKRRDSKDKKAGIDLDYIEQGKPKSLRDQRDSKVKTHPENIPGPSELEILLPGQKNQESERSSSTGPEDNSLPAASSHNTSNKKLPVQSYSVKSGARERDKGAPFKSMNQETDNQPPKKKIRTDGDEQDSTIHSHKLDTFITSQPSEDKSSSHDKFIWEKEKEMVSASNVPDDFPGKVYQQQYDTTTDVGRPDSRGGSDKSSQKEKENFANLLVLLKMEKYISNKLTLANVLEISAENSKGNKPQKIEDVPWCTLRKIMALDNTARHTFLDVDQPDLYTEEENYAFETIFEEPQSTSSIHPLDVICVLLHCSDCILQQEIVTKMAMCQFAVPLLLPAGDGSQCIFMLWAMRDIVKKWRPQSVADSKGFREENLVNISMPIISFVRLGKTKLSKSKILNQILNPAQQHQNFFIHDDMGGGNSERKISDGLVEISWYFPSSRSDVFAEPFAVTNLRGDLETNWDQFTFLCEVSSAVFIFLETINEREFRLLSKCSQSDTMFYFIVNPSPGKNIEKETQSILLHLLPVLRSEKTHVIVKSRAEYDANIMKKLQNVLKNTTKKVKLGEAPKYFGKHNFVVDETTEECQKTRELANKITREIHDVAEYKKQTMKLQGDLWKQLSKNEKELCRMKNQGDENAEKYQSDLLSKCNNLHLEQYKHQIPKGIKMFTEALTDLSQKGRQFFLKWMKFNLDAISRANLTKLQSQYKEKCTNSKDKKELQDLDQKLSDSSLGIEHFLRELGQLYEAESSMTKQKQIERHKKKFAKLPGIAADLLLDGFPLELIDGDASNIPLQWITDVLTELDIKTERKCKLRVISVLGVQSTGKSTLLNTMFGLQFPVASRRCTRGAFMTLLNVKKNFQKKLGCHFILVIDTEGLKAPELASLEDSYEHDNELATLVVGLSDVTIVNVAMESTTEMKDMLQIVVHAFLRMREIGKKHNCQFVHQNVSDVSAHDNNMRDRKKLLEQLNEMTKVAAKMEKKHESSAFTDVMTYDLMKDNWYIPGLWQGDPPMAPVNLGYSSNVLDLKKYLFELMESEKSINKPSSISDFISLIESLWRSVKHEKFIFNKL